MQSDQKLTYKLDDYGVNQELSIYGMRYFGQADQYLFHQAIYNTGIQVFENADLTLLVIPEDFDLADRTVQILLRWGVDAQIMTNIRAFRGSITMQRALERLSF